MTVFCLRHLNICTEADLTIVISCIKQDASDKENWLTTCRDLQAITVTHLKEFLLNYLHNGLYSKI